MKIDEFAIFFCSHVVRSPNTTLTTCSLRYTVQHVMIAYVRKKRSGRSLRRWTLILILLVAALASLSDPVGAQSASLAPWPAGQVFRRAFINCYHAKDRGHPGQQPPPRSRAETAPADGQ